MLEKGGESAAGGHVIVFTDGQETSAPYISDAEAYVRSKNVIVHGLLLDGVADDHDLIKLAEATDGSFCIFEESRRGGSDYYQCLMDILQGISSFTVLEVRQNDYNN